MHKIIISKDSFNQKSIMKQPLTLLQVCKLPDVQIHSKTSFLKRIVNQETAEVMMMRENIAKLSYTIKIIGVNDQQVGIMSKRVPLKYKSKENPIVQPNLQFQTAKQGFLPHKTFYSAPLGPVFRKQKIVKPKQQFQIVGNSNFTFSQNQRINTGFRARVQSMSALRSSGSYWNGDNKLIFTIPKRSSSTENRKSYSKVLREINGKKNTLLMHPISHQENPMFKRIKKLSKLTKIQQDGSINQTSYLQNFPDPQKAAE